MRAFSAYRLHVGYDLFDAECELMAQLGFILKALSVPLFGLFCCGYKMPIQ